MLSWAGSDAANKSKPTKIAKKQEPSTTKILRSAIPRPESSRPATMTKRTFWDSQHEDRAYLSPYLQWYQGVSFPRRQPHLRLQRRNQRAEILREQPDRIRQILASINSPPTSAQGVRLSQERRPIRLQLIERLIQSIAYHLCHMYITERITR